MFINARRFYVLQDQEGTGGAGGSAAGDAGAAAAAGAGAGQAGAGGTDGQAAGAGGQPGSVLAAGAPAAGGAAAGTGAAAGAATDPHAWLGEKFRVTGQDGSLDIEASARKVAEAYHHAEKRIGSGDLPPKSADEYKVTLPESLADKVDAEALAKSDSYKDFLSKAHAAGLTQKQVDVMTSELLERSMRLQEGAQALSVEKATEQLREAWKTDAEFNANVQAAYKAGQAYGGEDFDSILKDYGNDARIVKLLAAVGRELGEDIGVPPEARGVSAEDVEALTKSKAYWDPNDPEHARTKAKVEAFYARQFGTAPKASGAVVFGG